MRCVCDILNARDVRCFAFCVQFLDLCEKYCRISFLCEYVLNCNLFLWSKLYFQHHYCSLQCHMIFRNHNNMLIWCSRTFLIIINVENINIFVETVMHFIFQDSQMNRKFKRTAFIWNRVFCNIILTLLINLMLLDE